MTVAAVAPLAAVVAPAVRWLKMTERGGVGKVAERELNGCKVT